jgi:hypothetical protein
MPNNSIVLDILALKMRFWPLKRNFSLLGEVGLSTSPKKSESEGIREEEKEGMEGRMEGREGNNL